MKLFKKLLLTAAISNSLLLVGCSDSSSGSDDTAPTENNSSVFTFSGQAADGYLVNAEACLDANNNGKCDSGELTATTDETGTYKFEATTFEELNHPLIITVIPGVTVDLDSPEQTVDMTYTLKAPAGSEFVSPLTTLVVAKLEQNSSNDDYTLDTAISELQAELDTTENVLGNYIEAQEDEANSEAEQLHNIARVIATSLQETFGQLDDAALAQEGIDPSDAMDEVTKKILQQVTEIRQAVERLDPKEFDPSIIFESIEDQITTNVEEIKDALENDSIIDNQGPELVDAPMDLNDFISASPSIVTIIEQSDSQYFMVKTDFEFTNNIASFNSYELYSAQREWVDPSLISETHALVYSEDIEDWVQPTSTYTLTQVEPGIFNAVDSTGVYSEVWSANVTDIESLNIKASYNNTNGFFNSLDNIIEDGVFSTGAKQIRWNREQLNTVHLLSQITPPQTGICAGETTAEQVNGNCNFVSIAGSWYAPATEFFQVFNTPGSFGGPVSGTSNTQQFIRLYVEDPTQTAGEARLSTSWNDNLSIEEYDYLGTWEVKNTPFQHIEIKDADGEIIQLFVKQNGFIRVVEVADNENDLDDLFSLLFNDVAINDLTEHLIEHDSSVGQL